MFFNVILTIIISIIVLFVIDNIINYFKNNLTAPKIKDLINKPKNDYEKINSVIKNMDKNKNRENKDMENKDMENKDMENIDMENIDMKNKDMKNKDNLKLMDTNVIKDEMKDFFKELNEKNVTSNNLISDYDTIHNSKYITSF